VELAGSHMVPVTNIAAGHILINPLSHHIIVCRSDQYHLDVVQEVGRERVSR
jgi:hypothetical protein